MGRGAVNQKGPQAAFLAALHAIRGAGRKLPVNLVLVAEGEEEIGSPNFPQIVLAPEVRAALRTSLGIFMPSAAQDLDGSVRSTLGAKGVVELELVASGEKWGRGPTQRRALEPGRARRQPGVAPGAGAQHARRRRTAIRRSTASSSKSGRSADAEHAMLDAAAQRIDEKHREEGARRRALGARRELARRRSRTRVAADAQHRGSRRRLHRPGRQDDPAAPRGREDRHAARARHDARGHDRQAQGAPRQARLRRHRGQVNGGVNYTTSTAPMRR